MYGAQTWARRHPTLAIFLCGYNSILPLFAWGSSSSSGGGAAVEDAHHGAGAGAAGRHGHGHGHGHDEDDEEEVSSGHDQPTLEAAFRQTTTTTNTTTTSTRAVRRAYGQQHSSDVLQRGMMRFGISGSGDIEDGGLFSGSDNSSASSGSGMDAYSVVSAGAAYQRMLNNAAGSGNYGSFGSPSAASASASAASPSASASAARARRPML